MPLGSITPTFPQNSSSAFYENAPCLTNRKHTANQKIVIEYDPRFKMVSTKGYAIYQSGKWNRKQNKERGTCGSHG